MRWTYLSDGGRVGKGNELLCKRKNLFVSILRMRKTKVQREIWRRKEERRKERQNFVGGGTVVSEFLVGVNCVLFCSFWMVVNRPCFAQRRGLG